MPRYNRAVPFIGAKKCTDAKRIYLRTEERSLREDLRRPSKKKVLSGT
jgi:hypothetical protein